jgi:hypothetical protein
MQTVHGWVLARRQKILADFALEIAQFVPKAQFFQAKSADFLFPSFFDGQAGVYPGYFLLLVLCAKCPPLPATTTSLAPNCHINKLITTYHSRSPRPL